MVGHHVFFDNLNLFLWQNSLKIFTIFLQIQENKPFFRYFETITTGDLHADSTRAKLCHPDITNLKPSQDFQDISLCLLLRIYG